MPETKHRPALWIAIALVLIGVLAPWVTFGATVRAFESPHDADLVLGVPIGVLTLSFAAVTITLAAAIAARVHGTGAPPTRNVPLGAAVIVFGIIGWWAAFALTADKVLLGLEPSADLGCNVSLLVQCGANLESWQGSVFGFPNPLIGVVAWAAVMVVGCLILARTRLAPWFWIIFNVGVAAALAFVIWLISQSIFMLGTLCPWCMVTWAVTIPLFWTVTLHNVAEGRFGDRTRRILGPAFGWVPAISIACYIIVGIIAQARLDLLNYL
jgi:uncharacterized membrane protein